MPGRIKSTHTAGGWWWISKFRLTNAASSMHVSGHNITSGAHAEHSVLQLSNMCTAIALLPMSCVFIHWIDSITVALPTLLMLLIPRLKVLTGSCS